MKKYIRQPTAIISEHDPETDTTKSSNIVSLQDFPTLTQVAFKHRGYIRSYRRLKLGSLPFDYAVLLHPEVIPNANKRDEESTKRLRQIPEVIKAKRQLRKMFKDYEQKIELGHFNGIVFTQVVYCNQVIQAFFEFALKYAVIGVVEQKRRFSIQNAKGAFKSAFEHLFKFPAKNTNRGVKRRKTTKSHKTNKEIEQREAAIKILNHTYALEHTLSEETLNKFRQGRKPGSVKKDTKRIVELAKQGYTINEIVDDVYPNCPEEQRKYHLENVKQTLYRHGIKTQKPAKRKISQK